MTKTEPPESRFVGIAIGKYAHEPFAQLELAPEIVGDIAKEFAKHGVETRLAEQTDEGSLIAEFRKSLLPRSDDEPTHPSSLVVLWTGHGERRADQPLVLVTSSSRKNELATIDAKWVTSAAIDTGAQQILIIFDTCYSGAGTKDALLAADAALAGRTDAPDGVWLGILASAMDWSKAREGYFSERFLHLLRDGPDPSEDPSEDYEWSPHNAWITGDEVVRRLWKDVSKGSTTPLKSPLRLGAETGRLIPNPRYDPRAPSAIVEHLLLAARGGERDDERSYFTGRRELLKLIVDRMGDPTPGVQVLTGPPGSGKSAVLGYLACLSDPVMRPMFLTEAHAGDPDPGERSVHAQVHARGLAKAQFARTVDAQLIHRGVIPADPGGARGTSELIDAVREAVAPGGRLPVILVDGLDEAGAEAGKIASDLLLPLAEYAILIVSTRDVLTPGDSKPIVATLENGVSSALRLPDHVDDRADIREYVRRRLIPKAGDGPSPMDPEAVADALVSITSHSDEGRFLVARIVTAQLLAHPVDTSAPGWEGSLATSVDEAFDHDLEALPPLVRDGVEFPNAAADFLSALAWAKGSGCPGDIWPLLATAVASDGSEYSGADVAWALRTAGRYVVEDGEAGHAVYRLAHQSLADHLRAVVRARSTDDLEVRVARAVTDAYTDLLAQGLAPDDHQYLWRYTWRHCGEAGPAGMELLSGVAAVVGPEFDRDLAMASTIIVEQAQLDGDDARARLAAEDAVERWRTVLDGEDTPSARLEFAGAVSTLLSLASADDPIGPERTLRLASEAADLLRAVDPSALSLPMQRRLISLLMASSTVQLELGHPADMIATLDETVRRARVLAPTIPDFAALVPIGLAGLAPMLYIVGRSDRAISVANEAVTEFRDHPLDDGGRQVRDLKLLCADLMNDLGRYEDAQALALEIHNALGDQELWGAEERHVDGRCWTILSDSRAGFEDWEYAADFASVAAGFLTDNEFAPDRSELASALLALGIALHRLGRSDEAVPPLEEAVRIFEEVLTGSLGWISLPNLSRSLAALAEARARTGDAADALVVAERALEVLADRPENAYFFLPARAEALMAGARLRLAAGDSAGAIAKAEEAVGEACEAAVIDFERGRELAFTVREFQALVRASGDEDRDVWRETVDRLPAGNARAQFLIRRSKALEGDDLVEKVLDDAIAAVHEPGVAGTTRLWARTYTLLFARERPAEFRARWALRSTDPLPDWIDLTEEIIDVVAGWGDLRSAVERREYHRAHEAELASPAARLVVTELTPDSIDIERFTALVRDVEARGVDAAYREFVVTEAVLDWNALDLDGRLARLDDPASFELLCDPHAADVLSPADSEPDPRMLFNLALLTLAEHSLARRAVEAFADPDDARRFMAELRDAADPVTLRAACEVLLGVVDDQDLRSDAHLDLAIALRLSGGSLESAAAEIRAAGELGPERRSEWADRLGRLGASHPPLLELIGMLYRPSG